MKKIIFLVIIYFFYSFRVYSQFKFWYDLNPGISYGSLVVGDIDNDKDLDLVMTGTGPAMGDWYLKVYTNNPIGNLNESQNLGPGCYFSYSEFGDSDFDGDLDLIVMGLNFTHSYITIYTNNSKGVFFNSQSLAPGVAEGGLAIGDIDCDLDLDLVITGDPEGGGRQFRIYTNSGAGYFNTYYDVSSGMGDGSCVVLGDLDFDSDLDIIVTGRNGGQNLKVYKNDGAGNYNLTQDLIQGYEGSSIILGDIDSDADLDLIAAGLSGGTNRLDIFKNNSAGSFSINQRLLPGVYYGCIASGDIDSDGDLDLVAVGSGICNVYTNNGSGDFNIVQDSIPGLSESSAVLSDLDSDGDLDLIMSGSTSFKVYKNTNSRINNPPSIPFGMKAVEVNGFWKFFWNPASDDHTSQNMLYYQIAIGTRQSSVYDYMSAVIAYPRGQANIGNIHPDRNLPAQYYFQSKISASQKVYWKVCAIDSAFKNGDFCAEQVTGELYSHVTKLEPSEGVYFIRYGKITGEAYSSWNDEAGLGFVEIRIKNIKSSKYWNGANWTEYTNSWIRVNGKEYWEYNCSGINWDYNERHYVESRPVRNNGLKGSISMRIEFIPVYQLSKYSFCNYPNPFDPKKELTCIEYLLLKDESVQLLIFDINGGKVGEWKYAKSETGGKQGVNRVFWNGKNIQGYIVANGVYFCYLKTDNDKKMTRILILK
ncbi:MAG: FG-GAP-like repeat-containing protein [bacterium]|nr:FG-GAP-like repeat-containing protein [bacterium]